MNIYDIKKNTIMKKLKYVKLFESFLNEELSPELKKRTYDAMIKIANDPNAIDNLKRRSQASNIMKSLSPAVENLRKELEVHAKKVYPKAENIKVNIIDNGLDTDSGGFGGYDINGCVLLTVTMNDEYTLLNLLIAKDKYEKSKSMQGTANNFYGDRAFVNTLKKLIVQIQKDEIPGEEEVPSEPTSVTKEGEIVLNTNTMEEDDISKYGTGGSGLPDFRSEAGQIARGR